MTLLREKRCVPCEGGLGRLDRAAAELLLASVTGWEITGGTAWLHQSWTFCNFADALAFVNAIGSIAEAENHHPDIRFGWSYVEIYLQTHAIGGLHENDFILAARINAISSPVMS